MTVRGFLQVCVLMHFTKEEFISHAPSPHLLFEKMLHSYIWRLEQTCWHTLRLKNVNTST